MQSVAVTKTGKIYITETDHDRNNKIHELRTDGYIRRMAGIRSPHGCRFYHGYYRTRCYAGDGQKAANAILNAPSALAIGTDNTVYIADQGEQSNFIVQSNPSIRALWMAFNNLLGTSQCIQLDI